MLQKNRNRKNPMARNQVFLLRAMDFFKHPGEY